MASYTPPPGSDPQVPVTAPGQSDPRGGFRVTPKMIAFLVLLAIVLWFVFANTGDVAIKLWVTTVSAPMWIVLLCTFLVGMIAGWLLNRRRTATRRAKAAARIR